MRNRDHKYAHRVLRRYTEVYVAEFPFIGQLNWSTVPENFLEIEVRAGSIHLILVMVTDSVTSRSEIRKHMVRSQS